KTYPDPNTHPDLVQIMNAARARATMAMREARIERNRRRRLKGIAEHDVLLGDDSVVSSLSDPGSDLNDGEDDDGESDDEQSAGTSCAAMPFSRRLRLRSMRTSRIAIVALARAAFMIW